MDSVLLTIDPRDALWIAIAFLFGLAARVVGLPPLVGFLCAGFALHAGGAEAGEFLRVTADLGVTLLLFTIGLKLKLNSLARPEVWGVATLHLGSVTLLMAGFVMLLGATGIGVLADMDAQTALLIGFALSFSSTVFAVKILDQIGAASTRHARISIGILIIQDIAAVGFVAITAGKLPTLGALALLLLIPLRHVLFAVLTRIGHGELLILFGIVLAIGGADLFEMVQMKGDLGALVVGMLLASHPKANELAKALLGFKDLFLVGFFLTVGMTALPGLNELLIALLLLIFLPLKVALYFGLLSLFKVRARNAWQSSLNLANYSEFGLIVGAMAMASGWLAAEWMAVFAIVLSLSFAISAPLATAGDHLYTRWRPSLKRFEREQRLPLDEEIHLPDTRVVIFGMGRVGSAIHDAMQAEYGGQLLGVESDEDRARDHQAQGRLVITGDSTNVDFWSRVPGLAGQLEWVILALPSHAANLSSASLLREHGFQGRIAATTRYPDEAEALEALGVEFAFNIHAEAGLGFVEDLRQRREEFEAKAAAHDP
ncbi:MAG: cation:proton antiporter [Gammaproteobacteria bacterium]